MQKTLIEFFTSVLAGDSHTLEIVEKYKGNMSFDVDANILIFKLKDLHKFLFDPDELDYPNFQKLLYQSNLNEKLASIGGRVEIHQSVGKVDDNYYRLVKVQAGKNLS